MDSIKKNFFVFAVILALLAIFRIFYFSNLEWGTPSWEKHLQIFEGKMELENWAPQIIELRKKYYSGIEDLLNPEKPFKETYDKLFLSHQSLPLFHQLPQELVLDRIRGYLIGVTNSDEQYVLVALSRLNPLKLQFNPGMFSGFGGFYYYSCGPLLLAAKFMGWLSLKRDIQFYFFHPEETGKMYALVRSVGGLSLLLTTGLLFLWIARSYRWSIALLTVLFLILTPLFVPYTHMAKAHNYGMFLFMLGFYFLWKTVANSTLQNYLLAGLILGLSAATIITNLSLGILIFLVEWSRNEWNFARTFRNRNFWLTVLVFFITFLIADFYLFANFSSFQRFLLALKEYTRGYDEYGAVNFKNWLPFLKDLFVNQLHWSVLPLLLVGLWISFTEKNRFLLVCSISFLLLTLVNLFTTRHPGVNIRTFPLIAILCAFGSHSLLENRPKFFKCIGGIYIFLALLFSGLQTAFYASLLRGSGNLLPAGVWVNSNIPAGETIGVPGARIIQMGFPPIRFLNYRLIHFPESSQPVPFSESQLPTYVVTTDDTSPILKSHYALLQSWRRPKSFLGVPFESNMVASDQVDLFIFKKS